MMSFKKRIKGIKRIYYQERRTKCQEEMEQGQWVKALAQGEEWDSAGKEVAKEEAVLEQARSGNAFAPNAVEPSNTSRECPVHRCNVLPVAHR